VTEQIILDETFSRLWQDQDVFAAAAGMEGRIVRKLEQRQTLEVNLDGQRYFIKYHKGVTWREIAKNLFQLRLPVISARNEKVALEKLQLLGVRVPRIAAYGRRGLLPSTVESFLVTGDVGPHVTLEEHCRDWQQNPPAFREKLALLNKVADISRIMHQSGICHRDFYICHLLLLEQGDVAVIDLHRALTKKRLSRRWLIKDLAGLRFSTIQAGLKQRDLLRFARRYQGISLRELTGRQQRFWLAVERRARRMVENSKP
jgi:heptose I phosphotransferase